MCDLLERGSIYSQLCAQLSLMKFKPVFFVFLFLTPLQVTSRWIPLINERTDKDSRCINKDKKCELGFTAMGISVEDVN